MNTKPIIIALSMAASCTHAAIVNVSFHAHDTFAQSSPYYSHYGVTSDLGVPLWHGAGDGVPEVVSVVNLMDFGWGFSSTGTSSYHVMTRIDEARNSPRPLRSVGWHEFAFIFDTVAQSMSITMNGTEIQSGTYANPISWFYFAYNGGGGHQTIIDDFTVTWNGNIVYQTGFEDGSLDPAWAITRSDPGSFVRSDDGTNPYSGTGALAIGGAVTGVAFDLTTVPEPSSALIALLGSSLAFLRRAR